MVETIFLIILVCSLIGIGVMLYRKIPFLLELPETSELQFSLGDLFSKTKDFIPTEGLSSSFFLQKILSKVRILTLKTDHKTSNMLQKLRESSQKNKFGEDENYWKDIKKKIK